jgi:histidyl-tRNA synthetase
MIKPQIPKGFRDFLPHTMALRKRVIGIMTDIFECFGFEPLDTPCLEYAETLEGKYGEEGDKLIYKFRDRGERNVALRYDLTIPLSRVAAMYPELPKPFKRYQIAPVWRADKPQKGRYREFYQCDIDIIGTGSSYADGELLVITSRVLQKLGFTSFLMRINNRKVLNALAEAIGIQGNAIGAFLRCLDKLDKAGPEAVLKEMQTTAGLTHQGLDSVSRHILDERSDFDTVAGLIESLPEGRQGLQELEIMIRTLRDHGVDETLFKRDITLARGLDYYTGPVFETVVREPRIGSITGGGRYDDLIGLFSKQPIPATGTSFGLERIVAVMDELGMMAGVRAPVRVFLPLFDESLMPDTMRVAAMLRDAGFTTEVYYQADKLKKQMAYAAARGFALTVIIGPDEARTATATLKYMDSGEQMVLGLSDLPGAVREYGVRYAV